MEKTGIRSVMSAQRSYFLSGETKDRGGRKKCLQNLQKSLLKYRSGILASLSADLGKSAAESVSTEFDPVFLEIRRLIKYLGRGFSGGRRRFSFLGFSLFPSFAYEELRARGLVLILSNWSMPFLTAVLPAVYAIAAGNTVIIKPSELAPHTSSLLSAVLGDVFPLEHLMVIEGGGDTGEILCSEGPDFIYFTGNGYTGKKIMRTAAERLTPLSLNLGGKNPCIVSSKADLKLAAEEIFRAKKDNCGQNCKAPDYIIVHESVCDALVKCLSEIIREKLGVDPINECEYPPIVNVEHFERLVRLLESGRIAWGGRTDRKQLKIEPTILVDTDFDSPVMQQEIFGPLLPVLTYDKPVSMIQLLNVLPHPQTAYFFSKDREEIKLMQIHLITGALQINGYAYGSAAAHRFSASGIGESGFGAINGMNGIRMFSYPRTTFSFCNFFHKYSGSKDEEKIVYEDL